MICYTHCLDDMSILYYIHINFIYYIYVYISQLGVLNYIHNVPVISTCIMLYPLISHCITIRFNCIAKSWDITGYNMMQLDQAGIKVDIILLQFSTYFDTSSFLPLSQVPYRWVDQTRNRGFLWEAFFRLG
jgi:hypothetical protein